MLSAWQELEKVTEHLDVVRRMLNPPSLEDLLRRFEDPDVPLSVLRVDLLGAWCRGPLPTLMLPRERWIGMFQRVGFLDVPAARPRDALPESLTLFRGAVEEHRRGMSWTSEEREARLYAHMRRVSIGCDHRIWKVTVPRAAVLAYINSAVADEYVVDVPADIEVVEV